MNKDEEELLRREKVEMQDYRIPYRASKAAKKSIKARRKFNRIRLVDWDKM
jgi:DNA-directed RNA polymerase subunit L